MNDNEEKVDDIQIPTVKEKMSDDISDMLPTDTKIPVGKEIPITPIEEEEEAPNEEVIEEDTVNDEEAPSEEEEEAPNEEVISDVTPVPSEVEIHNDGVSIEEEEAPPSEEVVDTQVNMTETIVNDEKTQEVTVVEDSIMGEVETPTTIQEDITEDNDAILGNDDTDMEVSYDDELEFEEEDRLAAAKQGSLYNVLTDSIDLSTIPLENFKKAGITSITINQDTKYTEKKAKTVAMSNNRRVIRAPAPFSKISFDMPAFTTDEISAIERYEGDEESKSLFLMEELIKSMRRIVGLPSQIEKTSGPDRIKKILQFIDHRDMESILFAKYAATFPGKNPIPIQCGDCDHTYTTYVDSNEMIIISDEKSNISNAVYASIIGQEMDPAHISAERKRLCGRLAIKVLNTSRHRVALKSPSIWKYLNTRRMAKMNGHLSGHDEDLYDILAFTKYYETLDLVTLQEKNVISYIKDNDRNEIIECIRRLHIDDKNELVDAVQEFRDYFYIRHMTPDSTCTSCKSLNTGVYLPIRSFLFFRIRQGKSIETAKAE